MADVNDTSLPVRVNNAGQDDRDMYSASLRLNYDTEYGSFSSVTSYDSLENIITGDAFDFLPIEESLFFSLFGVDFNQSQFLDLTSWSQEFRFTSSADKRLRWIVGAYMIGTDRFISTGNMLDFGNGVFPVFREPTTNPLNPQATFLSDKQDNFAWALFGNASYDVTDKIELDMSLRYDSDKREQTTLTPTGFLPNVPGFPQGISGEVRSKTFTELQPKVTLKYAPNDTVNLYAGYSTGFRSGGFNQTGVGAVAFAAGIIGVEDLFEAEVATTFEIGAKTQFLDRKLTLNVSAYTTKSENSYFFVFLATNGTQNLGNIPEVRLNGFEIDATLHPIEGLDINVGFGYTDSEIKDFSDASVIGNKAPLISETTLNIGIQYAHELGTTGVTSIIRVDYQRLGKTWWDLPNSTVRNPVNFVDARLSFEKDDWTLSAWVKNLTDKEYNTEFSPGGFVFKARPQRYGLNLTRRF